MSGQHTPGPWTAYKFGADWWVANESDDSGPMLRVGSWHDEREANARLIAAAPELVGVVEEWLTVGNDLKARKAIRAKARAALAKARGDA